MSGWRFYLFRWCIAALERDADEVTVNIQTAEDDEEDEPEISGGSFHDFERDVNPPDPMREEPWYDDRKRFGFSDG
jgi:hypothetical protein